mgnify:CR=1 FL=1
MKKTIVLCLAMFAFIHLFSLEYVAFKGGLNLANIWGKDVTSDFQNTTGVNLGVCFVNKLKSGNELQFEINYS